MRAEFRKTGWIEITAQTETEAFALKKWYKKNVLKLGKDAEVKSKIIFDWTYKD